MDFPCLCTAHKARFIQQTGQNKRANKVYRKLNNRIVLLSIQNEHLGHRSWEIGSADRDMVEQTLKVLQRKPVSYPPSRSWYTSLVWNEYVYFHTVKWLRMITTTYKATTAASIRETSQQAIQARPLIVASSRKCLPSCRKSSTMN